MINSVPKFPRIRTTEYQTCIQLEPPVAALMPLLTHSVNLARISLQELFTGIDDDMNSTSGNLAGCRSGGKTRRF